MNEGNQNDSEGLNDLLPVLVGDSTLANVSGNYFYRFAAQTKVRLWIDLPSVFPWRYCLMSYGASLVTVGCGANNDLNDTQLQYQIFTVETQDHDPTKIQMVAHGDLHVCVLPHSNNVTVASVCSAMDGYYGYWRWSLKAGS